MPKIYYNKKMAKSNEGTPIFVDVAEPQGQFSMQSSSYVVFTHLSKDLEQAVKEETLDEVVAVVPSVETEQTTTTELQFAADEKYNDTTAAENTYPLEGNETKKVIKCTEKPNGVQCPYKTNTQDRLIRHIRKVHRGENPFQCTMCDYSTYNKALFEEHVRIHQGIKPFKCRVCPYRSVSKKNTKKHELIHRPDNPLRCPQCDFIAKHERSLHVHIQLHSGSVKCPSCDFRTTSSASLAAHRRREHCDSKQDYTCDRCHAKCLVAVWSMVLVKCPTCAFRTTSSASLAAHRRREHCDSKQDYTCDRCHAKFKELKSVNTHRKNSQKCRDCGTMFCTKNLLSVHMQTEHQKFFRCKTFVCAICHWSSDNKAKILLHLIHHPKQVVNEKLVDLTILRTFGIME